MGEPLLRPPVGRALVEVEAVLPPIGVARAPLGRTDDLPADARLGPAAWGAQRRALGPRAGLLGLPAEQPVPPVPPVHPAPLLLSVVGQEGRPPRRMEDGDPTLQLPRLHDVLLDSDLRRFCPAVTRPRAQELDQRLASRLLRFSGLGLDGASHERLLCEQYAVRLGYTNSRAAAAGLEGDALVDGKALTIRGVVQGDVEMN
mmetsp:Transcript_100914/g.263114  ORF Transcript_100914/g.263114 Transcript_100914/m.263114 type:complete len:202 (-) Transcript_100914:243-848(-)